MPPEVAHLSQLTRLNASDNLLASLPPELAALSHLTDLDVSNNPLETGFPSLDMVARGVEALQVPQKRALHSP
jgi:Leucine-rich repeat (LRR) protein